MPDEPVTGINRRIATAAQNQLEAAHKKVGDQLGEPPPEPGESDPSEPEDDQKITINGEEITIGELKKQRMLNADYTHKTQALAEKEREYEKNLREAEEYITTVNGYFKEDKEGYDRMVKHFENKANPKPAPNGKEKPFHNRQYEEALQKQDKRMAELEKNNQDREIKMAVDAFRAENPGLNDDQVRGIIKQAVGDYDQAKDTLGNIKAAYEYLKTWTVEGQKSAEEAREKKLGAQFTGGGGQGGAGVPSLGEALKQSEIFQTPAESILGS